MIPRRLLLISLLLFGSALPAVAKIKIISITGASKTEYGDNIDPIIFGGTGGDDCNAEVGNTETCNSCDNLTSLEVCNTDRIYDNLRLTIQFSSDSQDGEPFIRPSDSSTDLSTVTKSGVEGKGGVHFVTVEWREVCIKLNTSDGITGCDGATSSFNFAESLTVGVESDAETIDVKVHDPDPTGGTDADTISYCEDTNIKGEGICDFTAYPGDGKVFITDLGRTSGFPSVGNIKVEALRFFIQNENDLNDFINSPSESVEPADLLVEAKTDGSVSTTSKIIDRLENGTKYFFRVAAVDQAQNVFGFTSDGAIAQYCGSPISDTCRFTARPDEVFGMLTEDFNCFIATASYGSSLDSRLTVLRDFRSKVLKGLPGGQAFIDFYYKNGPYAAQWIWKKPWAKSIVRVLLWPVYGFAWISLNWGLTAAITLLLVSLLTSFFAFRIAIQRTLRMWTRV